MHHKRPRIVAREALIKLITFMARQDYHERNQYLTVRPEPVGGLNQSFLSYLFRNNSYRLKYSRIG